MPKTAIAVMLSAALLLLSATSHARERAAPEDVLGPWLTEKEGAVIELYQCDKADKEREICGRIAWLEDPYTDDGKLKRDLENPVASLRDRPRCGLEVVTGLTRSDKDTWTDGRVYNPKDGQEYSAYLDVKEDERIRIRVFLGIPLIGKSEIWTRPGDDINIGCPDDPSDGG